MKLFYSKHVDVYQCFRWIMNSVQMSSQVIPSTGNRFDHHQNIHEITFNYVTALFNSLHIL